MKFTAKFRFTNSHCPMLCERSCILRVQLQQLSGWIFSSATFDSSPPNCQSSSPDGESRFIVPSHQLLLRGRNPPKQSLAAELQELQLPPACSALLAGWNSSTLHTPASHTGTARKTEKYHFVPKVQVHCPRLKGGCASLFGSFSNKKTQLSHFASNWNESTVYLNLLQTYTSAKMECSLTLTLL